MPNFKSIKETDRFPRGKGRGGPGKGLGLGKGLEKDKNLPEEPWTADWKVQKQDDAEISQVAKRIFATMFSE